MSSEPQLYRVNPESRESERIEEVNFAQLGLKERRDIQEWVAANPGILGEDLLIVSKEFSGFDRTNERLDLLAVDSDGKLVIIEMKRDDTGADAHWQAIKYASYLRSANEDDIIAMLAEYSGISSEEAGNRLLEHLNDINDLNKDQRIILASHRFAREVTSAALWLNEKAPGENLITCVTLTPYRDANTGSLYIQATTIIPVPGIDDYVVGIGTNSQDRGNRSQSSFAANMRRTKERNKNDEVTAFAREVDRLTLTKLPDDIKPNKKSQAAGGWPQFRYYNFWYSRPPWSNHHVCYSVHLRPRDGAETWHANVWFTNNRKLALPLLDGIRLHEHQRTDPKGIFVGMGYDTLNDDFADRIAEMLREFIEQITPIVDDPDNESDEAEVTASPDGAVQLT